ncbi:MAG: zinc-binding dehydrogenase, partial [Streptosporangiaceae bacterium]
MGLCAVAALALEGVRDLAVFGLAADAAQLDLAGRLGATRTGELDEQLPADHASFDLAIETAGHPDAVIAAVRLCRPGGRVVCVGLPSTTVAL